jgi:predicted PurR-regulated permease PerM
VTVGVFAAGVQLITVLTMTFFMLLDGKRLVAFGVRLRGRREEDRLRTLAENIYKSTAATSPGS